MKVRKYTLYIIDFENLREEEYKKIMENQRYLGTAKVFADGSADIGEWHDDHELNFNTTTKKEYEKYFR